MNDTSNAGGERVLFEGGPAVLPSVGAWAVAVLTLGLGALLYWARARSRHYRITTQRVVVERGWLSKRIEQVDLYRIRDYVIELPLGQRLVGTGNLVLSAVDPSTPWLRLDGLRADVRALYEEVRAATEAAKRTRGVRVVDDL